MGIDVSVKTIKEVGSTVKIDHLKTQITKFSEKLPDTDVPVLDPQKPVVPPKPDVLPKPDVEPPKTGTTPPKVDNPITPENPIDSGKLVVVDDGIPATSSIAREELRLKLAIEEGIPRTLDQVWGASLDDLAKAYRMDGAKITPKPPSSNSSGNAQIFIVEGHSLIKEVQFSPVSSESIHSGQYYKFTFVDGSKVKVIDPATYKVKYKLNSEGVYQADLEKKTAFYNSSGQRLVCKNDIWVLK
ncbi:hypothetical protein [Pseudomonas allokribbensis]|uniref:hypothetical protein n=1 Tax=Pseudomonas allokribbensis TaxID=2774460 RepID=UPI001787E158|nr:hypothetical protein [Pseudomonas allokribbensis]